MQLAPDHPCAIKLLASQCGPFLEDRQYSGCQAPDFWRTLQYRPYNVFLLFLYLRGGLFNNLSDATLSSLGNPPNMQINASVTEDPTFVNTSVTVYGIKIILVSIPTFSGVKNKIKPF